MKKIFLIPILLLISKVVAAQAPFPTANEIKQFLSSRTCVVLENNSLSVYNARIKEAVKNYWKITPYEFIDSTEFSLRRVNPAYSFIVLTLTNFEKDKSGSVFNFINILQGKKVDKLSENPEICAIPLSFAGENDFEYDYKLGLILEFMQKHARMISADPSLTGRKYLKYYNINAPEVMKKTVLVKEEDLAPELRTAEAIKAIYPFDIRIVTEEEIEKAIAGKASNTLIFHKVGPLGENKSGYCFKMLIGTDDADMYYYNQHKIDARNPNGLLISDLRRLARYK
jgi:hypothetical protein